MQRLKGPRSRSVVYTENQLFRYGKASALTIYDNCLNLMNAMFTFVQGSIDKGTKVCVF